MSVCLCIATVSLHAWKHVYMLAVDCTYTYYIVNVLVLLQACMYVCMCVRVFSIVMSVCVCSYSVIACMETCVYV